MKIRYVYICDPRQVSASDKAPSERLPSPRPPTGGATAPSIAPSTTGSPASPGSDSSPAYINPAGGSLSPFMPPQSQQEEAPVTATVTSLQVLDGLDRGRHS